MSDPFFVTGGTLRADAPSYVKRKADLELYDGLKEGHFCYVLTSRQMGKSSLMVRTVIQLRKEGDRVAVLDLTAIGQNLTVEQWYAGLVERLGDQLNLDDELEDYWDDHGQLGPSQRFFATIGHVLQRYIQKEQKLYIFIDEIDSIRSLPFSTDEFFAGIRELYNRRTENKAWQRIGFCLLGVATPSDLIKDTRTTPFNVGKRIELRDFSKIEAAPLAKGIEVAHEPHVAHELLQRIMHWTNGHPYLTQRFCHEVSSDSKVQTAADVDEVCHRLFLNERARETNDNLTFVRERILRSEIGRAALLHFYRKILSGKKIPDDPSNHLLCALGLAGIVKSSDNRRIIVRNQIYRHVFDKHWVENNMPDAELRRQKEAFWQGMIRTALAGGFVFVIVFSLAVYAFVQAKRADQAAEDEQYQRKLAEEARKKAEASAQQVTETLARMEIQRAEEFLNSDRANLGIAYLADVIRQNPSNQVAAARLISALTHRNFAFPENRSRRYGPGGKESSELNFGEKRYIGIRDDEVRIFDDQGIPITPPMLHEGAIGFAEFSPDGTRISTGSFDNTARVWDATTGEPITPPLPHRGRVTSARFSPDGLRLVTTSVGREARIWDAMTGKPLTEPMQHELPISSARFIRDGTSIVVSTMRNSRFVWDVRPKNSLPLIVSHPKRIHQIAFSPDGNTLLTTSADNSAILWNVKTGKEAAPPLLHERQVVYGSFSPDGKQVVTASDDHSARVWKVEDGSQLPILLEHDQRVTSALFSPDGGYIVTASIDGTARIWNAQTGELVCPPLQHRREVSHTGFSADGSLLVTVSRARQVNVWKTATGEKAMNEISVRGPAIYATLDGPGKRLAICSLNEAQVWDIESGQSSSVDLVHNAVVLAADFSPDAKRLVTVSVDRTARVWDAETGEPTGIPLIHSAEVFNTGFFSDSKRIFTTTATHSTRVWDVETLQPITEKLTFEHQHRYSPIGFQRYELSKLSSREDLLASAIDETKIALWHIHHPPMPVPKWLAPLAETIAGDRINERGLLERSQRRDFEKMQSDIHEEGHRNFYSDWVDWFLSPHETRSISPGSPVTITQLAQRISAEGTLEDLRKAAHMDPANADILSRYALALFDGTSVEELDSPAAAQADFLSSYALEHATPDDLTPWFSRALILVRLTRTDDAATVLKNLLVEAPSDDIRRQSLREIRKFDELIQGLRQSTVWNEFEESVGEL